MEKYDNGNRERFQFTAVLNEALYAIKKGNKEWKLGYCPCRLISGKILHQNIDLKVEPIETGTLNQLFTKVSVTYRPDNASHNCNVFKVFRVAKTGVTLDKMRNQI